MQNTINTISLRVNSVSTPGLVGPPTPPVSGLDSYFFNKENDLTTDGLEVVNTEGDNAVIKCSYCAHASGDGEQIKVSEASILALGLNDLMLEWWAKMPETPANFDNSIGCTSANSTTKFGTYIIGPYLFFTFEIPGHSFVASIDDFPLDNAWHHYKFVLDRNHDMALFIDNVAKKTIGISEAVSISVDAWANDFRIGAAGMLSNAVWGSGTTQYMDVKLMYGDQVVLNLPLQGSCYDISGNGRHAAFGNSIWAVQDQYHYNLLKGYGLGVEELVDGNMESVGVGAWAVGHSAILTKETDNPHAGTQCLRIDYNGVNWAQAYQTTLTVGKNYKIVGWARSDGSGLPEIYNDEVVWRGSTSTNWHKLDVVFQARHINIIFQNGSAGDSYVEFDNISVKETYVPRLADDSGFPVAVTEEHLAGFNNMPESYFEFVTSIGGDDIMDKSNVAIWSADIRASVHYDSENPDRWHSSELVQAYLDDNIAPAYKNRIFVADNNTTWLKDGGSWLVDGDSYLVELGNGATEAKHLLVYNTTQTGTNLEKIVKFLAKQY